MDDWESDQAHTWERQNGKGSIPPTQGARYREAITLVCPLEIKAAIPVPTVTAVNQQQKPSVLRPRRTAAETARTRIRLAAEEDVC